MKNKELKISVIIRAYNSAKFISKAVESALNQTLNKKHYEVLVVDDGSKDNTSDVLKRYNKKIRIIRQKNLGPATATNKGILKSKGEYIILLDSDDQFLPDILEKMLSQFENNQLIDFAYCDYFEKNGNTKKKISLKNNIFNSLACAIMFKKKLFNEVGLYDKNMIFGEYDLLIKLIKNKRIGKHIPVPLYIYNRIKNSLTSDSNMVETGIWQLKEKYGDVADKIRSY